jgi:hypothetical protein
MASMTTAPCDCWICASMAAWLDEGPASTGGPFGAPAPTSGLERIDRVALWFSAFGRS